MTYLGRIELDTGLNDIDRGQSGVGDGAANTPGQSTLEVEHGGVL